MSILCMCEKPSGAPDCCEESRRMRKPHENSFGQPDSHNGVPWDESNSSMNRKIKRQPPEAWRSPWDRSDVSLHQLLVYTGYTLGKPSCRSTHVDSLSVVVLAFIRQAREQALHLHRQHKLQHKPGGGAHRHIP